MISKVATNIYRGPRPKDLSDLLPYKIDTIADLESGVYDLVQVYSETYKEQYVQFPADFGMRYYHMPCSDIFPPRREYILKCLELMQSGCVIFIHCLSGVDRTGFVVAVYRMRVQGWTYEQALAEWKSMGRHPWYFYWEKELRKHA